MKTEIVGDSLIFNFDDYVPGARFQIDFMRTLRIPDDGKTYQLPPGLGKFPLREVDTFADKVPPSWAKRGGIFLPMYQAEAMWMNFSVTTVPDRWVPFPFAIRVFTGKVSALTGDTFEAGLKEGDYLVVPGQRWLDGFVVEKGKIRQFIATPMGSGFSVEKQITGKEETGGFQIEVIPMKREVFEAKFPKKTVAQRRGGVMRSGSVMSFGAAPAAASPVYYGGALESINMVQEASDSEGYEESFGAAPIAVAAIGSGPTVASGQSLHIEATLASAEVKTRGRVTTKSLAPEARPVLNADMAMSAGGSMAQDVYKDENALSDWDTDNSLKVFLNLCDALAYPAITGQTVPHPPPTPADYKRFGYTWFTYYDSSKEAMEATDKMKDLKGIQEQSFEKGWSPVPDNTSVDDSKVKNLGDAPPGPLKKEGIRDGEW